MEHTNSERKSISELIKEAEEKDMQLVFVDASSKASRHAELIAKMLAKADVMVISIETLPEADRERMSKMEKKPLPEKDFFKGLTDELITQVIEIKNYNDEMLTDIEISKHESKKGSVLPKQTKPFKGHSNNFKQQFKGRQRH